MTFDERVQAVAKVGLTERQARFLVTVMLHAGVCVPRQYARFAGIAYGHKVNRFFDKLVRRGHATATDCLHNRGQLYHVRHFALYRAIEQPDSRYRRPVSGRLAIERVMILDGILTSTELVWLGTEDADTYVDITEMLEVKLKALACHASQMRGFPYEEAVRRRAAEIGAAAGMEYAEGFRTFSFRTGRDEPAADHDESTEQA